MVLCMTGKKLDIREEKIQQKLPELACFRILLKVTCRYKRITRTWAYARETCLAIYMRVKRVRSCVKRVLCASETYTRYTLHLTGTVYSVCVY